MKHGIDSFCGNVKSFKAYLLLQRRLAEVKADLERLARGSETMFIVLGVILAILAFLFSIGLAKEVVDSIKVERKLDRSWRQIWKENHWGIDVVIVAFIASVWIARACNIIFLN